MKRTLSLFAVLTLVACDEGMTPMANDVNSTMIPDTDTAETATLGNTVVN